MSPSIEPHTPPAAEPAPWFDLASHWQLIGQEWAHWWMHSTHGVASTPDGRSTPSLEVPPALAPALIEPQALAALNAKFAPRFQALWAQSTFPAAGAPAGEPAGGPPGASPSKPPVSADRRFASRDWQDLPYFAFLRDGYLLTSEYLNELAALAPLPPADKHRLAFATRQVIDALSPANFPATNPDVLKRAIATEGASFARGAANLVADARKGRITMADEAAFEVGRNLALSPGDVVFRNELVELIQYAPSTERVHRRPLLIVPPCINKYYILDLQPTNSFVRHAVAAGHTVFLISWRNIPPELGHVTWDDYLEQGVLAALEVVQQVSGSRTVNTLGFCVGGTLLASALAVLAARRERSVESATFLTTMLDFEDPGEIGVYISKDLLEARRSALMSGQRVHGSELAGAFASLRANDLVWNYVVGNYLKGETPPAFDLLYWNGDSSNLPGPMYAYYLENMYLANRLRVPDALTMAGETIDLGRITMPAYVLATRDDHIVPWRSAYRTTALVGGDATFVLGASGHIAGVVNPPAANRRNYWTNELLTDDADEWFDRAQSQPGSWWTHWTQWLAPHGGPLHAAPRHAGSAAHPPLAPAPGSYVRERA